MIYLDGACSIRTELKATFQTFASLALWNKWWFDELYWAVFVAPSMLLSKWIAWFDRNFIDSILHGAASTCKGGSSIVARLGDETIVNGTFDGLARGTWDFGHWLRKIQTGSLRQYVLFIVISTVALFAAVSVTPRDHFRPVTFFLHR